MILAQKISQILLYLKKIWVYINAAINITLDEHSLYLGNSYCNTICSLPDIHIDRNDYIDLQFEFHSIAREIRTCYPQWRFLINKDFSLSN